MQLFQPCSRPEQSKAIADLSSGLGAGSGMAFCAFSIGPTGGSAGSGITVCAQPAMTQARASTIEALSCTFILQCLMPVIGVASGATSSRDPHHDPILADASVDDSKRG